MNEMALNIIAEHPEQHLYYTEQCPFYVMLIFKMLRVMTPIFAAVYNLSFT